MAFNRILIGFTILLFFTLSYFLEQDFILFIIISILSIFEIYNLISNSLKKKINLFFFFLLIIVLFFSIIFSNNVILIFIFFFIFSVILIFVSKVYYEIFFGFSFLIVLFLLYEILNTDRTLFYQIFMLAFLNDTIAYLIGTKIKGPLILPSISPKKTWSGTLSSFLIIFLLLIFINYNFLFSIILSISFFFGDVFFSFIKRQKKIKDFSKILLSHGGILDRLDSMYFFIPLICLNNFIL